MDKGRAKLRCNHYNPYNLRLTRYRRLRVEITKLDMRRHTRFLPDNNNENELVAVDHNQQAVPLQQRHPQHQRRRAHNRQRARNRQHAQEQIGGSVWSKKEEKVLFKAIVHYKKYNKSSRLNWDTVFGYYALSGGAATSVTQLQIHWRTIKALKKAGHFNDCSFFNDPDCTKDFDLVFEEGSSSSSSAATRGDTCWSSYRPFQGNIAPENRRVLEVFSVNNQAIEELVQFHMIDGHEAAFAREKFANVNNVSAMEHFSFIKNNVVRADFIRCAIAANSQSRP